MHHVIGGNKKNTMQCLWGKRKTVIGFENKKNIGTGIGVKNFGFNAPFYPGEKTHTYHYIQGGEIRYTTVTPRNDVGMQYRKYLAWYLL